MATFADRIRKALDKFAERTPPTDDTAYNRGFAYGMQCVIEAIAFELHQQTDASKYPNLALEVMAETARQGGLDVTKGYDRIMVSIPMTRQQGEEVIAAKFVPVEKTPIQVPALTPVGETPIGPGDVF